MFATLVPFAMALAAPPDLDHAIHIHVERTIDAPVDEAWRFFAEDFDHIGDWVDTMESRAMEPHETPDGLTADADAPFPGRVVDNDGTTQIHVLVDFDPEDHTFTFRAASLPRVIRYAHNQHSLVDVGNGSTRVELDVVMVPGGIAKLIKGKIETKFTAYLEDYLDAAEAGLLTDAVSDGGEEG